MRIVIERWQEASKSKLSHLAPSEPPRTVPINLEGMPKNLTAYRSAGRGCAVFRLVHPARLEFSKSSSAISATAAVRNNALERGRAGGGSKALVWFIFNVLVVVRKRYPDKKQAFQTRLETELAEYQTITRPLRQTVLNAEFYRTSINKCYNVIKLFLFELWV